MAENNIIIKITGEADLDAAQTQMKELTDKAKEQERALKELTKQEKEDAKTIKSLGLEEGRLAKRLKENEKYYQDLRDQKKGDIAATKQSIKALQDQVKSYKTMHGQSGRMVQQLRAMREELQRMEDSGQFGTEAFVNLAIAAGQLEDQIGDTQQRIRILSSDTIGLDTALGVADGISGAFYIATSAAEVFGSDLESLQKAFYRVQAAISVVTGVQQVANALNKDSVVMVVAQTAAMKLKSKALARNAALTAANTVATGVQTGVTGLATKAQIAFNTAIAANPLGAFIALVVGAVAAIGALAYGLFKLFTRNSAAEKAQEQFEDASERLEEIRRKDAISESKRLFERQKQIKATSTAEEKALQEAEKRNASELELAEIKLKYAKRNAKETQKYANAEITEINKQLVELRKMKEEKQAEVNAYKDGSKKKKTAMEELAEVEKDYYETFQKGIDLENERAEAFAAEEKALQELENTRKQLLLDAEQAKIDLMREGAAKEIAQINFNYKEQLKTLQGNSSEETRLRKLLLKKQKKEIAEVRRKYAEEEQKTAIQEQKNLLKLMSQMTGSEAGYADQLQLTKEIAEAEAQARIDALNKEALSEKAYAAEVEAIRLELNDTLRDIDEREIERKNDYSKRMTEIAVAEMEATTKALNGSEGIGEQLEVWDEYYSALEHQIRENAEFERQAIERSTATAEEKAAQIKRIDQDMQASLIANEKAAAEQRIEIYAQNVSALELEAAKASDALEKAQTGSKLEALRANLDAQTALYDAQAEQLEAQWQAGLISFQDYEQQKWEITKATTDARVQYEMDSMNAISEGFQTALGYIQEASDLAFEAINNNIQAQMDALDEEYTTDWEEAQKNAKKKYITEEEYEKKKAALEMKQAKFAKAQALTNIAIQTALSIITTLAQLGATPWGIAAAAIAGTMGAAQLAIAAAKPLAQYEKGRKGGPGEYALVGEKGPEIMYIPRGASIIPNNKIDNPAAWAQFGVPELPHANPDTLHYASEHGAFGQSIDYERLGAAVAAAMPKQRNVTVNVDRSGVHVSNGSSKHTYLNTKYNGVWN